MFYSREYSFLYVLVNFLSCVCVCCVSPYIHYICLLKYSPATLRQAGTYILTGLPPITVVYVKLCSLR